MVFFVLRTILDDQIIDLLVDLGNMIFLCLTGRLDQLWINCPMPGHPLLLLLKPLRSTLGRRLLNLPLCRRHLRNRCPRSATILSILHLLLSSITISLLSCTYYICIGSVFSSCSSVGSVITARFAAKAASNQGCN